MRSSLRRCIVFALLILVIGAGEAPAVGFDGTKARDKQCPSDDPGMLGQDRRRCLEKLSADRIAMLAQQLENGPARRPALQPGAGGAAEAMAPSPETPLRVLRITPEGLDVPPGRQVVFQFDRPVVPVGRMERTAAEIPITMTPEINCQWRWLNTSALACQLGEKDPLRPATAYRIDIRPGLRTADGAVMTKARRHRFTTQRPRITRTRFAEWRAPGWPRIQVTFNQPVSRSSAAKHLTFKTAAMKTAVGVSVVPDGRDRQAPHVLSLPGEKWQLSDPAPTSQRVDDRPALVGADEARRIWMVAPLKELPLESAVDLRVEPGLVSALGPEPGVERRTVVQFHTYPKFRFLGVRCRDAATGDFTLIPAGSEPAAQILCAPLSGVALVFSAPVIHEAIRDHLTITPDLAGGRKDYDPWANYRSYSRLTSPHREGRTYSLWLPERLQADRGYTLVSTAGQIRDAFDRPLDEPVAMRFRTAHRDPALVLNHRKAVLEKRIDSDIPIYVTNLDRLTVSHQVIKSGGRLDEGQTTRPIPEAEDVAFAIPMGVRDILAGDSGLVTGRLDSDPRPPNYPPDGYRFFAQVTPFQVHVKLGHFNALVWVTELATGKPVGDAVVSVYRDDYAPDPAPVAIASARTDASGVCHLPGIEALDPQLKHVRYTYDDNRQRLMVRVDKGDDLAVVPLDHHFRTYSGGVTTATRVKHGHMRAWGTTAQGVYKSGDTIQYKFYVRNHDNRRWIAPARDGYALKIIDPKGQTTHEIKDLALSAFGAFAGDFKLDKRAPVGWYRFKLDYAGGDRSMPVMRVLVSDFTPAPFRVRTELNGDRFAPGDAIVVTTLAQMHAGGPYAGADTRVTLRLQPAAFLPETSPAKDFRFDAAPRDHRTPWDLHQSSRAGNDQGEVTTRVTLADRQIVYGRLTVESAVRDDRGKYVAATARADYVGRDRFVGLRTNRWIHEQGRPAAFEYLVVDADGRPIAELPVEIDVKRRETKASRVKGAGNAYLTKYVTTWVDAVSGQGRSADRPATFTFMPEHPGDYRITARIRDTQGRTHATTMQAWVVGKGRVVWEGPNTNRLQIIPDKTHYQVGDKARFLVPNPLPGARALITVERYGVLRHWVQTLKGSTPVIEVPIEADDLPGFYLSVLVTAPRVEPPPGDGDVDLGKPTFRLGYLAVPVKDTTKEIAVTVKTASEVYKPRETVRARIRAVARQGAEDTPIELAVAVIDEAVFDLNRQGRDYYDPYQGFNHLDGLDLNNYTLLARLVGRQKFEQKGADPGGGGAAGRGPRLRGLFKYVSYWNPSLIPDARGRAEIAFEVPDNLTGWRIFVMAVTPDDRMGLGDAAFKVNRPTEIRPVMPNQVVTGDVFQAGFSVMNRTDRARTIGVEIRADGPLDRRTSAPQKALDLDLAPFERETVWLPVRTRSSGTLRFEARAGDALDRDAVAHSLVVRKRRSLVTAATYGTTTRAEVRDRLAFPPGIHPDAGGVSVVVSPSVIGNLDGAFRYLRDYPYACWEQLLTRAVMAAHYQHLKAYLPEDFSWPASTSLPGEVLAGAAGFQAPNGGMAYWLPEDRYVSPYLSAYTALAFNWLRLSGHPASAAVETKLQNYLQRMLRRDVLPSFYTRGMASSVRAVALAALAANGQIVLDDLERHQPHLGEMDLFGKAHFLQAALYVDGGRPLAMEAARMILAHASQSGGKVQFNEVLDDSYSYMLATPLRSNAAVLSALLRLAADADGRGLAGDIPFKLVRAITQSRGNRDHWENTQENVFVLNALAAFSRIYETETPAMTVRAFLGPRPIGATRFSSLSDDAVTFSDPEQQVTPGLKTEVRLEKEGPGRLYYATRMRYAPTEQSAERINAGIDVRREYAVARDGRWVRLQSPMAIRRGELVRVDLFVSLPTLRHFVVVDDPVPGGLEPVNRDLATASSVDVAKGEFKAATGSWWFNYSDWSDYGRFGYSFYHQELRHHAARFFADYLPAGRYHLTYTAQAIAAGRFAVMPVHAEEMYDPDVFGQGLPATLTVEP